MPAPNAEKKPIVDRYEKPIIDRYKKKSIVDRYAKKPTISPVAPIEPVEPRGDFVSAAFDAPELKAPEALKTPEALLAYPELIAKSLAKGAVTTIPKTLLSAEAVKKRAIKDVTGIGSELVPKPAGASPEERIKAINEIRATKGLPPLPPPVAPKAPAEAESPAFTFMRKKVAEVEEALKVDTKGIKARELVAQASETIGHTVGTGFNLLLVAASAAAKKSEEALIRGATLPVALGAGTVSGLTEYFTEKIPLAILKRPGLSFGKRLLKGIAADAPGEVAATLIEMGVIDEGMLGLDYDWPQYKQAIKDTLIISGLVTGGATVITSPFVPPRVTPTETGQPTPPSPPLPEAALPPLVSEKAPDLRETLPEAVREQAPTAEQRVKGLPLLYNDDGSLSEISKKDPFLKEKLKAKKLKDLRETLPESVREQVSTGEQAVEGVREIESEIDDFEKLTRKEELSFMARLVGQKEADSRAEKRVKSQLRVIMSQSNIKLALEHRGIEGAKETVNELFDMHIQDTKHFGRPEETVIWEELKEKFSTSQTKVLGAVNRKLLKTVPDLRETLPETVREQVPTDKQVIMEHETKLAEAKARLKRTQKQLAKKPDLVDEIRLKRVERLQKKAVTAQEKLVESVKKEVPTHTPTPIIIKGKSTLAEALPPGSLARQAITLDPNKEEDPDIYDIEEIDSGEPITLEGFTGTGRADKLSIYAEGITEPALGKGKYIAQAKASAVQYGPEVTKETVTLNNPLFITSDRELASFIGAPFIPTDNKSRIPLLKKARKKLEMQGRDGVVINVPLYTDMNSRGDSVKRIREIFGETQIFIPTKKEVPTAQESVVSGVLPVDRSGERGAITIPAPKGVKVSPAKESRVQDFVNSFKEFWTPLSTLPQSEEYLKGRYRTLGKIYQVDRIVKTIKKDTSTLAPEGKYSVFRALNGDKDIESLTPKERFVAKRVQNTFNIVGKMGVKRGIMTQETFDRHKGQYVPYLYLRHILDDSSPVSLNPSGKLNLSHQMQRAGLSKAEQRKRGLVEDISIAAPVGLGRELSDIVKFDRYKEIAENPNWTFEPSRVKVDNKTMGIGELAEEVKITEKMNRQAPNVPEIKARLAVLTEALDKASAVTESPPKNFVRLPVSKKLGPLSGAFVRKEVARDLIPEINPRNKNTTSNLIKYAVELDAKAMAAFKVSKVALNPPTVIRNAISNPLQMRLGGVPFHQQVRNMGAAVIQMKKNGREFTLFKRHGGLKTNWSVAEIDSVFDAVKTMQKENSMVAGLKKVANLYGKIDDFYKFSMFLNERRKGRTPGDSMLEAQKWIMDYTRVHPSVRAARRHIMPLSTYRYKIIPLIAESVKKRPWVLASLASIPLALTAIAKKNLNLSDEEFEKAKAELPSFLEESGAYAPMLWRSKEGNLQWVNVEHFFPWSNIADVGRNMVEGQFGQIIKDNVGSPATDILSMIETTARGQVPKDPFTNRPVYNQLDNPTDKALKLGEWVYNKWAPTFLTRHGTLGKASRIGEIDKYGREATAGQAAASFFGANVIAPTKKQGAIEKVMRIKELRSSLIKIVTDPTISTAEKVRARREYARQIQELGLGKRNQERN